MAAVAQYPQQTGFQQTGFQPTQTSGSVSNEDPLLTSLRQYLTSGPGATHITTSQLQKLYQDETARDGGKAALQVTIASHQLGTPGCDCWDFDGFATGNVDIAKTNFNFKVRCLDKIDFTATGDIPGVFTAFKGPMTSAKLYWNDSQQLAPGPVTVKATAQQVQLTIEFYRAGSTLIATFVAYPISFYLAPGSRLGSGVVE
ncbi:MAG: hypothetical protein MMC33_005263 [Icmadophila ericetorum]|nr:hypothetical protein [Icmadophila ericetorum]